jgi:type IV pilus assembly protein PilP
MKGMNIDIKPLLEKLSGMAKDRKKLALIVVPALVVVLGGGAATYLMFFQETPAPKKVVTIVRKTAPGAKDNKTEQKGVSSDNKTAVAAPDNKTVASAKDNISSAVGGPGTEKDSYRYSSTSRRDPFMPLIILRQDTERKKGESPVEDYDISDFKLIAILWNKTGYFALITLPDGKSYTLRTGTRLGLNSGKVYKITNDSVIIKEPARDYKGAIVEKEKIIKLRKGEEG